jgi:hypothetical protein
MRFALGEFPALGLRPVRPQRASGDRRGMCSWPSQSPALKSERVADRGLLLGASRVDTQHLAEDVVSTNEVILQSP